MNKLYYFIHNKNGNKEMNMKTVTIISLILTIIGAINWGLVGLFNYDLVASIAGVGTMTTKTIYTLVGISGVINLRILFDLFDKADK